MEPTTALPEIPADLQQSRPRQVRLSGAGRAQVLLIALLLAGAPTAAFLMSRAAIAQREVARELDMNGAVISATVTQLKRESKDSNRASVSYAFDVDGGSYRARAKVPMALWRELHVGDTLPVRYVAGAPAHNIPDGLSPRVLPLWLPYLVAAIMLVAGIACVAVLRAQRRLLEDGRVAHATVRKLTVRRSQHGTHRSITYEFRTLGGSLVTGKSGTSSKPPAVGTGILVLYDPDTPTRNKPYPLSLVRLEVL